MRDGRAVLVSLAAVVLVTTTSGVIAANASAPRGGLVVSGASLKEHAASVVPRYDVTFSETGIPPKTLAREGWYVWVNGTRAFSEVAKFTTTLPNGTYYSLIAGPPGFVTTAGVTVEVAGATTVTVSFQAGSTQSLQFREWGLPRGAHWCVQVDGSPWCNTAPSIRYPNLSSGTYVYGIVSPVKGQYITQWPNDLAANGTLHLVGSTTIRYTFAYDYGLTFTERGLPGGNWIVTIKGKGHVVAAATEPAGTDAVFHLPNGTYSYKVGAIAGYTYSGLPSRVTVNGAAQSVTVTFTKT